MVIECSSCQARFKLADDKIKESGTKVRCTKCREIFTVFPENSPAIPPQVIVEAPVVMTDNDMKGDDFFSVEDNSPVAPEKPFPAVDIPVSTTDDWNQKNEPSLFAGDAETSDLDAINFDNFETSVFTATDTSSKFEFNDDSAFSLEDSTLNIEVEQHKVTPQTKDQSMSGNNDFEADFSSPPPSISAPTETIQTSNVATDSDFSFSEAESSADFSWGEVTIAPQEPLSQNASQEKQTSPQSSAFDFGSVSFDQETEPEPVVSEKSRQDDTVALTESESSIKLSVGTGNSPASAPVRSTTTTPTKSSPTRPPRPRSRSRSRQTPKGLSSLIVKGLVAILITSGIVLGIMNREIIQKEFKNLVSGIIEKQVTVETSGQIGLAKLTGSYVLHSQEGNLFVIRGEAINEFKGLRSSVLVKATIYGENGVVLQNQSAYCGNSLNDDSLKKSGLKEIRGAMNNELGENLVNLNIGAGKTIPCMIVFDKVPSNIKEFTVEVVDSKSGSK